MTARLPEVGGDQGNWGSILNDYLKTSHNDDGTLANNTVGTNQLQNNSVTTAQLDIFLQATLGSAISLSASANGVKGDGVTDDTAALNTLIQTALSEKKVVLLDVGPIKTTGAIDMRGDGLVVRRAARTDTGTGTIQATNVTTQAVLIGGVGQDLDLNVIYQSSATNVNAIAFQVYKSFKSNYRLQSYNAAVGLSLYQGAVASTRDNVAGNYLFSCTLELMTQNFSICGLDTTPYNASNTGCEWRNIYLQQPSGAPALNTYAAKVVQSNNEVFNQFNIEGGSWSSSGGPLFIQGSNVVINSLHLEGDTIAGWGYGVITIDNTAIVTVNGLTIQGCIIADGGYDNKGLFKITGNSRVTISGLMWGTGNTVSEPHFGLCDANDQTGEMRAYSVGASALSVFTSLAVEDTGQFPVLKQVNSRVYHEISSAGTNVLWGAAAPTTNTWNRGDVFWNTNPAAGGTPGWVCTTAGNPGVWKAMASLAS